MLTRLLLLGRSSYQEVLRQVMDLARFHGSCDGNRMVRKTVSFNVFFCANVCFSLQKSWRALLKW